MKHVWAVVTSAEDFNRIVREAMMMKTMRMTLMTKMMIMVFMLMKTVMVMMTMNCDENDSGDILMRMII